MGLQQKEIADHVVVIDAESKLIIDGAKEYAMKLSKNVLCLCGGPEPTNLDVVEAHLIVDQVTSQRFF